MGFKEYLQEKKANTSNNLMHMIDAGKIPISPKMMQRLNQSKKMRVFHITNEGGVDKIIKMQGSKKTISTLTRLDDEYLISGGITNSAGFVVELDGMVHFDTDFDHFSSIEKSSGRRWVPNQFFNEVIQRDYKKFVDKHNEKFIKDARKVLGEFGIKSYEYKSPNSINLAVKDETQIRTKVSFDLKKYNKLVQKYMVDFYKEIEKILKYGLDFGPGDAGYEGVYYDEKLAEVIKVVKIYADKEFYTVYLDTQFSHEIMNKEYELPNERWEKQGYKFEISNKKSIQRDIKQLSGPL